MASSQIITLIKIESLQYSDKIAYEGLISKNIINCSAVRTVTNINSSCIIIAFKVRYL